MAPPIPGALNRSTPPPIRELGKRPKRLRGVARPPPRSGPHQDLHPNDNASRTILPTTEDTNHVAADELDPQAIAPGARTGDRPRPRPVPKHRSQALELRHGVLPLEDGQLTPTHLQDLLIGKVRIDEALLASPGEQAPLSPPAPAQIQHPPPDAGTDRDAPHQPKRPESRSRAGLRADDDYSKHPATAIGSHRPDWTPQRRLRLPRGRRRPSLAGRGL